MIRWKLLDKWSFAIVVLLSLLGLVFIRSATPPPSMYHGVWLKQLIWLGAGFVVYFVFARIDYKKFVSNANIFYFAGLLALVLLLLIAPEINGARSWFRLPFMSAQPSEFFKIAMVLMLAKFFSRFQERQSSVLEYLLSCILIGIPFCLIILQPDLGTALVYLPFFFIPNFLVGNKESLWLAALAVVLAGGIIGAVVLKPNWVFFLKGYQKDRIVAFIYPDRDTSNTGYQVYQSKISIGQGSLFGKGIGKGEQTKLGFLPAQHNDFILAVAAEETGFVGISAIFILFLILFLRGVLTALEASDVMGSVLAMLVIGTLFVQTMFNAAMLIGMVPTTGIPCPLLSYGGSSLLTTMGLLGLIQSVRTHRFVNQ